MAKKPIVQGGVENYLGKQPQVVAPRKWQSSPDAPATELAYITKAEKDLILKKDIHGSLDKGPNMGPSGIMSLDSFGDVGGGGAGGADTDAGGGARDNARFSGRGPSETKSDFDMRTMNQREILQKAEQRQAEALGERERRNISNFRSRRGPFGLGSLFSTALGFINPFLGMASRFVTSIPGGIQTFKNSPTLVDFYKNITGGNTTIDEEDEGTLLDQVSDDLPFAQSYLQSLQPSAVTGTNYPGSNMGGITQTGVFDNSPYGNSQIDVGYPSDDLMAFNPGTKLDRTLKNMYSGYENLNIENPQMIDLMKQDIRQNQEKGTPLSLPRNAYSLIG